MRPPQHREHALSHSRTVVIQCDPTHKTDDHTGTQSRPKHTVRGGDGLISKFGSLPAYKKYVAAEKNCPDTNEAPQTFVSCITTDYE